VLTHITLKEHLLPSTTSNASVPHAAAPPVERLPLAALLALASAAFITILTEALPAGLLPQMAHSLAVSEALVGQLVTIYAIGSLLAAIPLTALTQRLRKRPLLLAAIAGFAVANSITCLSDNFTVIMAARFLAGVSAGMLWALVAGYAARIAPPHRRGQAIAIAMVGTPLALSLGVPAGTLLGNIVGWRLCFGVITVMAVALIAWARTSLPDVPGQAPGAALSLRRVFTLPGVRPILFVVLAYVLAHNILYTYIASFLASAGLGERTDLVLLVFGLASLAGIWIVGVLIDRHLRLLTIASVLLFALAAVLLSIWSSAPVVYLAVALWGLAFGGSPTLFQTALSHAAGAATDVAQSMLVTGWNLAIAGGGIAGGLLLAGHGATALTPALLLLLAPTLAVVITKLM
jgi:predicted MFS family arabinose efflux permease